MEKVKTDGVEYVNDGHSSRTNQGPVWGAGIGAGLGGGILGFLLGRSGFGFGGNGCNNNCNTGCNNNCGCSENQYVNRFELEQAARTEKLEAELAKEKAERYADSVGINTFKEVMNYFDKNMERRDKLAADLTVAVAELDKNSAVNSEKLNCLRDKIAESHEAIASLSKSTTKAMASMKHEIEAWANTSFIHQPKVKLCCGAPTWECSSDNELI